MTRHAPLTVAIRRFASPDTQKRELKLKVMSEEFMDQSHKRSTSEITCAWLRQTILFGPVMPEVQRTMAVVVVGWKIGFRVYGPAERISGVANNDRMFGCSV